MPPARAPLLLPPLSQSYVVASLASAPFNLDPDSVSFSPAAALYRPETTIVMTTTDGYIAASLAGDTLFAQSVVGASVGEYCGSYGPVSVAVSDASLNIMNGAVRMVITGATQDSPQDAAIVAACYATLSQSPDSPAGAPRLIRSIWRRGRAQWAMGDPVFGAVGFADVKTLVAAIYGVVVGPQADGRDAQTVVGLIGNAAVQTSLSLNLQQSALSPWPTLLPGHLATTPRKATGLTYAAVTRPCSSQTTLATLLRACSPSP